MWATQPHLTQSLNKEQMHDWFIKTTRSWPGINGARARLLQRQHDFWSVVPYRGSEKEGGKIPTFGRLAFRLQTTKRELRAASNRLTPEDIGSLTVVLEENDIEYPIDIREVNETEDVYPLRQYATGVTQDVIALGREKACADLALNEANYETTNKVTLSGTSQFTDPNSDPIGVIKTGIRAIKRTTGRKPNVCAISGDVWEVLSEHPKVLEKSNMWRQPY